MDLKKIGLDNYFEEKYEQYKNKGFSLGRISSEHKNLYRVLTERGEVIGEISGKMRHDAEESGNYPAVGDWVVITVLNGEERVIINDILSRRSKFSRKAAGINTREQIASANIDIVFLVTSLNMNFNLRRMERYLIMAWESGAKPVIILSKADLCEDVEEKVLEVEKIAIGVPIHVTSSLKGEGVEELRKYFEGNRTVVLLGSSGVGKSTLINEMIGEDILDTGEISATEDKGKHTTTYRQLVMLPDGGVVIDTPGMRELQLWDGSEGISEAFEDIERLSRSCYFTDCRHQKEPKCAVRDAIENGTLSLERFENYKKLQRELRFLEKKQSTLEKISAKKNRKSTSKSRNKDEYDYI